MLRKLFDWLVIGHIIEVNPGHRNRDQFLDGYIAALEIAGNMDGPLFRTSGRRTGVQHAAWCNRALIKFYNGTRRASERRLATTTCLLQVSPYT
jgi:hypothetical protein